MIRISALVLTDLSAEAVVRWIRSVNCAISFIQSVGPKCGWTELIPVCSRAFTYYTVSVSSVGVIVIYYLVVVLVVHRRQ